MHIILITLVALGLGYYFFVSKGSEPDALEDLRSLDDLNLKPFDPATVDTEKNCCAIALISGYPDLSVDAMLKVFNDRWGKIGEFIDMGGSGNIRKIGFDGLAIEFELQGPPLNAQDLNLLDFDPDHIPEIEHDISDYSATVIVRVPRPEDSIRPVTFLSYGLGALTKSSQQVKGAWWASSNQFISRSRVIKEIVNAKLFEIPVNVWVSVNMFTDDRSGTSGYTCGLRTIGLDEFEAINSPESQKDLKDRLRGIATYSIVNCSKILSGDTTGYTEQEKLRIKKEPSKTVHKGWVFRLYYLN